jgi:hypothetical protein
MMRVRICKSNARLTDLAMGKLVPSQMWAVMDPPVREKLLQSGDTTMKAPIHLRICDASISRNCELVLSDPLAELEKP